MQQRIDELDFLKGVFIILMITLSYPENGYGYNCNHVTFMIVEIIKLFYMPINGRTFWKKLGTFLAERWHESRSFMPIKSQFP